MITIDDPETVYLVSEWARRTGVPAEELVRDAVRERAGAMGIHASAGATVAPEERARRRAILLDVARRMDEVPDADSRSADEIIGYDEHGVPT